MSGAVAAREDEAMGATVMATVMAYETGESIGTEEVALDLLRASRAAGDTGAVSAHRDAAGVWQLAHGAADAVTVYFDADDLAALDPVVRRHNGQCAYGEPVDLDDVSWEVREALADVRGASGIVTVGGQRYEWTRAEQSADG